jgi:transposase-like protein
MTSCPECSSANSESLLTMNDDRQDDEHTVTITKYRCHSCGCEFQQIERWGVETEVTAHGREFEP